MKVLHLVQGYRPAIGGTEFLIQNVSEKLVELYGDDVNVLTSNAYNCEVFNTFGQKTMPPGEEIINGVKVKRLKVINKLAPELKWLQRGFFKLRLPYNGWARTLYSGPLLRGIIPEIRRAEADVAAASSFPLMHMHYAGAIKRLKKIPLVLIGGLHPEDRWGFDRKNIYKAIERADAYIAYTSYEKDHLVEKGIDAAKIEVIGVGTDPEPFAAATGLPIREKYRLNGDPVITFLGQQGGHKGIDYLIKAMPLVWQQVPEARLVIAGARTNYSPYLDKLIGKLDDSRRRQVTVITGFSEADKAEILAAGDIFASPSGYESFGITYVEAWAAKKPVIGCRGGAVPTVIDENQNGLLVDYEDHRELAGALLELLFDKDFSLRLAENGYQKMLANFTWEIVAKRFRGVYLKVTGNVGEKNPSDSA